MSCRTVLRLIGSSPHVRRTREVRYRRIFLVAASSSEGLLTERRTAAQPWRRELAFMSSRPEDSHLRALPDPYVNLSIHTAPDVRPFP